jgi:predicted metal-dependent peptidase
MADNNILERVKWIGIKDQMTLLQEFDLFGKMINPFHRVYTDKIPTLAVGFNPDSKRWDTNVLKTPTHRIGILLHEVMHVALKHCLRMLPSTLANVAADMIANEMLNVATNGKYNLRVLIPNGCFFDEPNDLHPKWNVYYEEDDSMEKVYLRLKKAQEEKAKQKQQQQKQQQQQQEEGKEENSGSSPGPGEDNEGEEESADSGSGDGDGEEESEGEGTSPGEEGKADSPGGSVIDDHSKWGGPLTPEDKTIAEQRLQEIITSAIKSCPQAFGNLPGNIQEMLMGKGRGTVRWSSVLRRFAQGSVEIEENQTYSRQSRRYGAGYPGVREDTGCRILFGVDMSGSVLKEFKELFLAEAKRASEYAEVHIAAFDVQIVDMKLYKPGVKVGNSNGGTDPQCVFNEAAKRRGFFDAVIILTDGEFAPVDIKGAHTLFVIIPGGTPRKEAQTITMEDCCIHGTEKRQ